jgi:hypothetical protein
MCEGCFRARVRTVSGRRAMMLMSHGVDEGGGSVGTGG